MNSRGGGAGGRGDFHRGGRFHDGGGGRGGRMNFDDGGRGRGSRGGRMMDGGRGMGLGRDGGRGGQFHDGPLSGRGRGSFHDGPHGPGGRGGRDHFFDGRGPGDGGGRGGMMDNANSGGRGRGFFGRGRGRGNFPHGPGHHVGRGRGPGNGPSAPLMDNKRDGGRGPGSQIFGNHGGPPNNHQPRGRLHSEDTSSQSNSSRPGGSNMFPPPHDEPSQFESNMNNSRNPNESMGNMTSPVKRGPNMINGREMHPNDFNPPPPPPPPPMYHHGGDRSHFPDKKRPRPDDTTSSMLDDNRQQDFHRNGPPPPMMGGGGPMIRNGSVGHPVSGPMAMGSGDRRGPPPPSPRRNFSQGGNSGGQGDNQQGGMRSNGWNNNMTYINSKNDTPNNNINHDSRGPPPNEDLRGPPPGDDFRGPPPSEEFHGSVNNGVERAQSQHGPFSPVGGPGERNGPNSLPLQQYSPNPQQDQFGRSIPPSQRQNSNFGSPPGVPFGGPGRGAGRGRGSFSGRPGRGGHFEDRRGSFGRGQQDFPRKQFDWFRNGPTIQSRDSTQGLKHDQSSSQARIPSQTMSSTDSTKKDGRGKEEEKKNVKGNKERPKSPPPSQQEPALPVHVVPPSPPPGKPSGLAMARARLADLTAQMEFQYAKHIQISKEHDIVKAKLSVLRTLPVGMDAVKEDLDKLMKQERKTA